MKWEEVIKNPDYQKLSTEEKQQWRKEYFDDIVKPKIKAEEYSSMWSEFSADADKMEGIKPESDKGFMNDVWQATKKGAYSALTGAGKSYVGQKATQLVKGIGLETPYFDDPYEPQTTAEKIISGAAGVVRICLYTRQAGQ